MHSSVAAAAALNIRLELASRAEDVPIARELLSGVADAAAVERGFMDDIRTAVTEACNNVVQHAYDGVPGPIELDLSLRSDAIEVTVRDHGGGMRPWIRTAESSTLGIGLMVIKALAESVEFRDRPQGGLEVRMRFATPGLSALCPDGETPLAPERLDAPASTSIAVAIGPISLAAAVLPRLLGAMAARAHFSTDRISDLQMVGDAIAGHAARAIDGSHLCLRIAASPRLVTVTVSQLLHGGAQRLFSDATLEGVGGVIDRLVDEREIRAEDTTETLLLRMRDHR